MRYPFTLCKLLSAAATVLVLPLAGIIPASLAWENGLLENTQAILLALGCLGNAVLYCRKKEKIFGSEMYLWQSMLYALMLGRELSWGRVFFCVSMNAGEPSFASYPLAVTRVLHFCIAIYSAVLLLTLMEWAPWDWLVNLNYDIPKIFLMAAVVSTVFSLVGDHFQNYLGGCFGQNMEELGETVLYFNLLNLSAWYDKILTNRCQHIGEGQALF